MISAKRAVIMPRYIHNLPDWPEFALRDISDLIERGILRKDAGGGRSTSYSLAEVALV
ncbi:hypothetical protein [Microvirga massiliensis]|uniref:hypothetical protein n=1 Tax=Microvirga massiliensis TaxID=1033741 RepID=UPI000A911C94|nr:hypothetical protein [Microvirga massiliensis]